MGRNSRLGLVGLVLGGSLFASGCANLGPADYAGAALTAGAGPIAGRFGQNAGLAAGVAGSLSSTSGSREHDLNVARQTGAGYGGAGYVGSGMADPSYYNAVKSTWANEQDIIFTCEQCSSLENASPSGIWTRKGKEDKFDSAYVGVKRTFGSDEQLILTWTLNARRSPNPKDGYRIKLYRERGGAYAVVSDEKLNNCLGPNPFALGFSWVYRRGDSMPLSGRDWIGNGKAELWVGNKKKISETYFKVIDNAAQKISEDAGGKTKIIELIKGYKDLRDKGILTEEDYQKKVQPLLNQL